MMNQRFRLFVTFAVFLLIATQVHAQWTRVTNLPAIYLNTFDGVGINSTEYYVYSTMYYVDEQDQVTQYDSVQVRGRGNSTWNLSKKPYKIKFNQKEKFLGKGYAKAKKWTLLANAGDKTMIRNAITSAMGEFTSLKFNPAYKFVDFFLNGVYQGTYQISDQVDVRPHRVNVTEQDYPLTDESDITGGYLLEVDGFKDGLYFITEHYDVPIRIHYPDDEEIVASQYYYIVDYIKQFEEKLYATTFADSLEGYRAMVDSASLIDWYLCTEISANIDGFFSTYFYKEQQDPKLYWGPLWDYDIAYNNDYRMRNEQGLSTTAYSLMSNIGYGKAKNWVNRMWEDAWFINNVNNRYNQLLDSGLVDYLNNTIDSLVVLLDESKELNYQKWGINRRAYHEMVIYSSYDSYIDDLRSFISYHTDYLKTAFAARKPVEPTPPFVADNYYYRIVNSLTRKPMELLNGQVQQAPQQEERETADWTIIATDGGHFRIVNRSNDQALNDPTEGEVGPDVNVGTHLNAADVDEEDPRQLWDLLPQGSEGYYNLLNVYTQHVANLQGGSNADGTPVLSYTNNDRNATSKNRLWSIVSTGVVPEHPTLIGTPEPDAYALAYNADQQLLHFGAEVPSQLSFTVSVTNAAGRPVGRFLASESFSVSALPAGVYIVSWKVGGKQRSAKFAKR